MIRNARQNSNSEGATVYLVGRLGGQTARTINLHETAIFPELRGRGVLEEIGCVCDVRLSYRGIILRNMGGSSKNDLP